MYSARQFLCALAIFGSIQCSFAWSVDSRDAGVVGRRAWMVQSGQFLGAAMLSIPAKAIAADESTQVATDTIELKTFVDPQGLFSVTVPKNFFTLRRTQKGDLPDAKTGKGRRGSSIFTAGNMAKAEVVAIERYPVRVLLEENGIDASGKLETFPDIGDAKAIANLITLRRESESTKQINKQLSDVTLSPDGKELRFRQRSEIDVQKPDLLMEEYGVSQLFRITLAKVTLNSNDGNLMGIFASALEKDFDGGDSSLLEAIVESFAASDFSSNA